MKKVGVIIPSYNQERFLRKAIESVLENASNVDMDIAVIDGGSLDDSVTIIKEYASEFAYWCSEPDGGQSSAINKGIAKLPNCKFYLWLNSDDIFETPNAIKKMVQFAEDGNYEVCYGLSHFIDENNNVIGEYPVETFDYMKLGKRCFLSQPSVMFSRKAYEEIGPINEELEMCMDYEYWIRLAQKYEFGFLKEYIGATRMYNETKTSTMQKKHLEDAIKILMKYYRKVPMHWIVSKYLCDNPKSILQKCPRRLLMVLLFPQKKKIVSGCYSGKS